MDFRILGGNTKRNPEAKKSIVYGEKFEIPQNSCGDGRNWYIYIRAGKFAFGDLADETKEIKTERGRLYRVSRLLPGKIAVGSISFSTEAPVSKYFYEDFYGFVNLHE